MDEIERVLGMSVGAVHLAGRHGQALPRRVGPARASSMRVFAPGEDRNGDDDEILAGPRQPGVRRALRRRSTRRRSDEIELVRDAAPRVRRRGVPRRPADADVLRLGDQQLRRARGARRAGRPGAAAGRRAPRCSATVQPDEAKFTGVVFKIQANMDPAHRDRIAFVRVVLGPLRARHAARRSSRIGQGAAARTRVVSFLSQRRELLDEAYRRRHHRHPEPRRAAARRHADRGRGAAVHRAAVLRARDVPHASRWPTRCAPSSCAPA